MKTTTDDSITTNYTGSGKDHSKKKTDQQGQKKNNQAQPTPRSNLQVVWEQPKICFKRYSQPWAYRWKLIWHVEPHFDGSKP